MLYKTALISVFSEALESLDFSGKIGHSIIALKILKIFLILSKILGFQVFSSSKVARPVVYTKFISYKQSSFHFLWEQKLLK